MPTFTHSQIQPLVKVFSVNPCSTPPPTPTHTHTTPYSASHTFLLLATLHNLLDPQWQSVFTGMCFNLGLIKWYYAVTFLQSIWIKLHICLELSMLKLLLNLACCGLNLINIHIMYTTKEFPWKSKPSTQKDLPILQTAKDCSACDCCLSSGTASVAR
jgi:hypothetical protein